MTTAREIASRFWLDTFSKADLERAISAAIADEREACAKVVETLNGDFERDTGPRTVGALRSGIAAAIRNRSN